MAEEKTSENIAEVPALKTLSKSVADKVKEEVVVENGKTEIEKVTKKDK